MRSYGEYMALLFVNICYLLLFDVSKETKTAAAASHSSTQECIHFIWIAGQYSNPKRRYM